MKKHLLILLLAFCTSFHSTLNAQSLLPHHPEPPPVNPGYSFSRALFIDCANEIIQDIANGHVQGLEQLLSDFILSNYISYIILCDLENSNVFGNPLLENSLKVFILHMRNAFPGIQIGIKGSDAAFFQHTPFLHISERFGRECYPRDPMRIQSLVNNINYPGSTILQKRSEMCKFFIRAARLGNEESEQNSPHSIPCNTGFDAFYVQYRFWEYTNSLLDMQNEFKNLIDILYLLNGFKCLYNCTGFIDVEFSPTDIFKLQGWTSIDQITEIDPAADRLILPAFTNFADQVFDISCLSLHYITDPFSRPGSRVFIELLAESPAFNYCNQVVTPQNYLGDYLNGSTFPSGNMYSVEKKLLDKLNDPAYYCTACHCYSFTNNHYTTSNKNGNIFYGTIWGPYSMMSDHQLYRNKNTKEAWKKNKIPISQTVMDMMGRTYKAENFLELNSNLPSGIYIKTSVYQDGKNEIEKIVVNKYPD